MTDQQHYGGKLNDTRRHHNELNDLAGDIEQQIGQVVHNKPVAKSLEDVSRAAAEAMTLQFEATAKNVERMGLSTNEYIAKLVDDLNVQIEETAAIVRERGKAAQRIVADIGLATKTASDVCVDVVRKVGG